MSGTMAPTLSSTDLWARNVLAEDGAIDTTVLLLTIALALSSMSVMYMAVHILYGVWTFLQSRSPSWPKDNPQRSAETGNIRWPMTIRWNRPVNTCFLSENILDGEHVSQDRGENLLYYTTRFCFTNNRDGCLPEDESYRASVKYKQDLYTTNASITIRHRVEDGEKANEEEAICSSSSYCPKPECTLRRHSSLENMDSMRPNSTD